MRRREILQGGLAAGSLFLPLPRAWIWAQSGDALRLLNAPKLALVIGNGNYKDAPPLKNPVNDARAIGEALKASGFGVILKLDTGRSEMLDAIRAHVRLMEQKRHVGLFYFAGHAVQLSWRNFLLPVDAAIERIEDVARQSVDIARLMDGLAKAANPMNVIILDACRENPFGKYFRVRQKGLSQMDAPANTLLAYATAPGNVASDDGLYTENLLREIKVPEAKIEDVFKRVRLAVRLKSNGVQVPWESTSLEEDFWFLPPKRFGKASSLEKEQRFDEELAAWDRIKDAGDPAALAGFLGKYPSGNFAELAQVRLDGLLKAKGEHRAETVADPDNPFSKGTASVDTRFHVGDYYTYRTVDSMNGQERRTFTLRVTAVGDREVVYDGGRSVTDHLGNFIRSGTGNMGTDVQYFVTEYSVGRAWTTQYRFVTTSGALNFVEMDFRVVARERVSVPAGTFDAFVVRGQGQNLGSGTRLDYTYWIAPGQVRRHLMMTLNERRPSGQNSRTDRNELVAFQQKI